MTPKEALEAAAEIVEAGWSQGAACRDEAGNQLALFVGERSVVNPAGVAFSAYGAVCKAVSGGGWGSAGVSDPGLMWHVLYTVAKGDSPPGGTNYVHPVIGFNEAEGRTKAEVVDLLRRAAAEVEAKALVLA